MGVIGISTYMRKKLRRRPLLRLMGASKTRIDFPFSPFLPSLFFQLFKESAHFLGFYEWNFCLLIWAVSTLLSCHTLISYASTCTFVIVSRAHVLSLLLPSCNMNLKNCHCVLCYRLAHGCISWAVRLMERGSLPVFSCMRMIGW